MWFSIFPILRANQISHQRNILSEQIIQSLLRLYLGCYPGKVCCQRFNQWWRQILLEMNLLVPIDKIWQDILCLEGEHFSWHGTYVVNKKNTQTIKTKSTLGCKWAKVWSTVIAGKRQTSFTSCARGNFRSWSFVGQRSCSTFPTATHRMGSLIQSRRTFLNYMPCKVTQRASLVTCSIYFGYLIIGQEILQLYACRHIYNGGAWWSNVWHFSTVYTYVVSASIHEEGPAPKKRYRMFTIYRIHLIFPGLCAPPFGHMLWKRIPLIASLMRTGTVIFHVVIFSTKHWESIFSQHLVLEHSSNY